jgi:GGDEF domain-containing protein
VSASARKLLKDLARRQPDPYAGANVENTRRFGAAIWGVSLLVVAVLLPIFPPVEAIGVVGWAITMPFLVGLAGAIWYLARRPTLITFSVHLVAAYTCVVLLALLQWMAGGWSAPYHELLLALALGNALTHPARRFAPLMAAIWLSALAPLTYAGDHGALASVLVSLLLWTGMSCFCLVLMHSIRAHRTGLTEKGEAAERMARIDALTGLENRRAFDEAFPRALARGRRTGHPLTLVMADLDGFKQVNDLHGHVAGDAVLTAVAAALRLHARGTDRAFRWAGDEFAMLLEESDEQTRSAGLLAPARGDRPGCHDARRGTGHDHSRLGPRRRAWHAGQPDSRRRRRDARAQARARLAERLTVRWSCPAGAGRRRRP